MNRLHAKGMIHNPVGKAKSVLLTEEGIAESERLLREMSQDDLIRRPPSHKGSLCASK
jgi:hypothetical protein